MALINEREPLGMILRGATLAHALGAKSIAADLFRWAVLVLEAEARLPRLDELDRERNGGRSAA